jgi:hypothetical protein
MADRQKIMKTGRFGVQGMKKSLIFLLAAMLALTGCGTATQTAQSGAVPGGTEAWDEAAKLMAGTMLLESSNTPLDTEQRSSLLFLWKGYSAVITSSTAADEEIDGLLAQIKEVFTASQTSAIDAMGLTAETWSEKLADLGVMTGMPVAEEGMQGTQDAQSGMPQMPAGAEMPSGSVVVSGEAQRPSGNNNNQRTGGGPMQGGGAMPGGMSVSVMGGSSDLAAITGGANSSLLTMQATQQAGIGVANRTVNRILLNAVIQYLEGTPAR